MSGVNATAAAAATEGSNKMRAIYTDQYGAPEDVLHLKTVDKPKLEDDKVLIRIQAASTHAGDWHLIRGDPFFIRLMFGGIRKPTIHIPGSDMAGVVEAVGRDVTEFAPGEAVFGDVSEHGWGAFAEYVCVPPAAIATKPDNVTASQAATCGASAFAALQAVRDYAKVKPKQTVLINGASGGVGSFAVQIAKSYGAEVSAVCHTEKADMMSAIGADHVVDYTETDVTKAGAKYDVIIDAAAFRSPFDFVPILNAGGTYVMVGGSTARFFQMMFVGPWISKMKGVKAMFMESKPNKDDLLTIRDLLANGKIVPCLDRSFNLERVPDAVSHVEGRKVRGKVVIDVP